MATIGLTNDFFNKTLVRECLKFQYDIFDENFSLFRATTHTHYVTVRNDGERVKGRE